jgi:hypothetical protein
MIFQLVDKCVDYLFDKVVNVNKLEVFKNPNEIEENIFNAINTDKKFQPIEPNDTMVGVNIPDNHNNNLNSFHISNQNDQKNNEVKSSIFTLKSNKYSDPNRREVRTGAKRDFNKFNSFNESSVLEINEIVSILSEDKSNASVSNSKNIQNDETMKSSDTPKFLPQITAFNKKLDNPLTRKFETGLFRHKNSTRGSLLNSKSDVTSNSSKKDYKDEKNDKSSLKNLKLNQITSLNTEKSEKNEKVNNPFISESQLMTPEPHDESYDDFSQGNISGLDKLLEEVRKGKLNQSININEDKNPNSNMNTSIRKSNPLIAKIKENSSNHSSLKSKSNVSSPPIMKKVTFKKKSSLVVKSPQDSENSNNVTKNQNISVSSFKNSSNKN